MWLLTVLLSGLMNCLKSELQEAQVFTSHMSFFHDGRKYKSFEGLQLVFWPLDF